MAQLKLGVYVLSSHCYHFGSTVFLNGNFQSVNKMALHSQKHGTISRAGCWFYEKIIRSLTFS